MTTFKISDHDQQIFDDLRRHHLRHPGSVPAAIARLLQRETVTSHQINKARLEWLKLGLGKDATR
jgi:hypothetical protein